MPFLGKYGRFLQATDYAEETSWDGYDNGVDDVAGLDF